MNTDSITINYSKKAKAHELALLDLKSRDLSQMSPERLAELYLNVYNAIYTVLSAKK